MDISSLFAGLLFGIAGTACLFVLMTPPEYRPALFARMHTSIDKLHEKISAAIAKAKTP